MLEVAMNSQKVLKYISASLLVISWSACAPKKFDKDASINACQNFEQTCISTNGTDYFDYTKNIDGGSLDILFIDDNSGSMSFEQTRMANKFNEFINVLQNKKINYNIGIITTDVKTNTNPERSINRNGLLQNGNLIQFPNGKNVLSSQDSSADDQLMQFKKTITRSETLQCEQFLKQYPNTQPSASGLQSNCPSGDERGLFSLNLFIDNNADQLVRSNSHFAVVVLSDEDVRSGLYKRDVEQFKLEENDKPETVINKFSSKFPNNTFSFHSIIVQPNDNECLQFQSRQLGPANINPIDGITFNAVLGSYGSQYKILSDKTQGINGDICAGELPGRASDYGSQLSEIAKNVSNRITDMKIACVDPKNLSIDINPNLKNISWSLDENTIRFSNTLPANTNVHLKYECTSL